jgi:hypothetical protein
VAIFENSDKQPVAVSTAHSVSDVERVTQLIESPEPSVSSSQTEITYGNGHRALEQKTERNLGSDPDSHVSAKLTSTQTKDDTLHAAYAESRVDSLTLPDGTQERQTITVSTATRFVGDAPNLRPALDAVVAANHPGRLDPNPELEKMGISQSKQLEKISKGPDGVEHVDAYSSSIDPKGRSVSSHDVSDVTHMSGNGRADTIRQTTHQDSQGNQSKSKVIEDATYGLDGKIHTRVHTEAESLSPASMHKESYREQSGASELSPHVSDSLKAHLEKSGYTAKDAAETVNGVSQHLAQALNEHAMGAGGSVDFHASGPVAVSLSSGQASPQAGTISVSMDQLKAVHESGHIQSLDLTNTPSHAAGREMSI